MKTVPFNLSIVATRYRKQKFESINQAFIFSFIIQPIFKVKRTHLVKKKGSATKRYTFKYAPSKRLQE